MSDREVQPETSAECSLRDEKGAEIERLRIGHSYEQDRAISAERALGEAQAEVARLREAVEGIVATLSPGPICDRDLGDETCGLRDEATDVLLVARAVLAPRESATEAPRTRDGEQGGEREVGGIAAIAAERWRQIDEEGYTAEHDEHHSVRQFVATALAYLGAPNRAAWPIKRADPESGYFQRRDLVKAGALVAAAIDRLDAEESR